MKSQRVSFPEPPFPFMIITVFSWV